MHTNLFAKNRKLHNLQLPILISKKSDHFRHASSCNVHVYQFSTKSGSRSVKTVHTNLFANKLNCIDLQLAIRISRNHSFQT